MTASNGKATLQDANEENEMLLLAETLLPIALETLHPCEEEDEAVID